MHCFQIVQWIEQFWKGVNILLKQSTTNAFLYNKSKQFQHQSTCFSQRSHMTNLYGIILKQGVRHDVITCVSLHKPLTAEVDKKKSVIREHACVQMHVSRNEISYKYTVWYGLYHTTLWLMGKLNLTIVAQLNMILDEFAFKKNFCCF